MFPAVLGWGQRFMPRHADPALPERRRAQILEAARRCFLERGFRETTVEEICAEARFSPGALYRYFDAKADIVAAIALEARAHAQAALHRLEDGADLIDALTELALIFFAAFEGERDGALLADIWGEAARDRALAQALAARDGIVAARVAAAIARAQRAGRAYPALSPQDAAEALMAMLDGMALRLALRREAGSAAAARRFRAFAVHVLKPKR